MSKLQDLFYTNPTLPFMVAENMGNQVQFMQRSGHLDKSIKFSDLFLSYLGYNSQDDIGVIVSRLLNNICMFSRAGIGNYVFVSTNDKKLHIENKMKYNRLNIIVSDEVPDNEIWTTYWKLGDSCVHGGIQYTPDGILLSPDYQNYFLKATMK